MTNKSIGFKELLTEIRSTLQGGKRSSAAGLGPEAVEKAPEIHADPAGQRPEHPLPVSTEPPAADIDPLELALAPAPLAAGAPLPGAGAGLAVSPDRAATPSPSLESALVESVVRRVVWGGDRRRGVARLELDGDYAGTTIWVRGEGRTLEVEIALGASPESNALPARLLERLRARGLEVAAVEVR